MRGFASVRGVGGKRRSAAPGEVRSWCGRLFGSRQRGGTAINRTSHLASIPTYAPLDSTQTMPRLYLEVTGSSGASVMTALHYVSPI